MSQGDLCPKDRFLGEHTEVLITESPIRASAFQASACGMSGPIEKSKLYAILMRQ